MSRFRAASVAALASLAMVAGATSAAAAVDAGYPAAAPATLRVATVDAGLTRDTEGELAVDLASGGDEQAVQLARAVQRQRPDVLVLTGVDVDPDGVVVDSLRDTYFGAAQDGGRPIDYPYTFAVASNAGLQSGTDLDGDGEIGGAGDAYGYGDFEGQSSIAVFSTRPIDAANARTFNDLLWSKVPGNHLKNSGLGSVARASIPLQSTSLWDLPIGRGSTAIHVIATASAPGHLDGATDEVRREDQLAFLRDYVSGDPALRTVADDKGREGALEQGARAVVAGALGAADPVGDGDPSLERLLDGSALVDPDQGGTSSGASPSWWGDTLGRMLRASASATRLGAGFGRQDIAAATPSVSVLDEGLSPAVDTEQGSHRLVWVDVAD